MKKIVLMAMMMGLVAASYATVEIGYVASAGFYFDVDPNVGILGDATGNSTYLQLMYSADATQDATNTLAGIGLDGNGTGDDIYWQRTLLTENLNPGDFDDFAAGSGYYSQALAGGYFYAMIFQDSDIQGGDWYYYTPMTLISDVDLGVGGSPQSLELNTDLVGGNAIDAATKGGLVGQVIPEPATMLLFGIGGMGAWLLRRRQQA